MLYFEGLYTASVYGTLFESSKLILFGAKSSRELQQYQAMKSFKNILTLLHKWAFVREWVSVVFLYLLYFP